MRVGDMGGRVGDKIGSFGEETHCNESTDPFPVSSKEKRRCSSNVEVLRTMAWLSHKDGSNPKGMCRANVSGGARATPFPTLTCRRRLVA